MLKYIFDDFGKLYLITRRALKQTRLTTNGIAMHPLLISPQMERTLKNNAITGTDRRNACETVLRDTIRAKRNKNAAQVCARTFAFPRLNKELIIRRNPILAHYMEKGR